jgi:hypothetical protein
VEEEPTADQIREALEAQAEADAEWDGTLDTERGLRGFAEEMRVSHEELSYEELIVAPYFKWLVEQHKLADAGLPYSKVFPGGRVDMVAAATGEPTAV